MFQGCYLITVRNAINKDVQCFACLLTDYLIFSIEEQNLITFPYINDIVKVTRTNNIFKSIIRCIARLILDKILPSWI